MPFKLQHFSLENPKMAAIAAHHHCDETHCVSQLIEQATLSEDANQHIHRQATQLVKRVRRNRQAQGGLDAFMAQYDLSSQEGIALMCLAEALLRVPDAKTANRLIRDKICQADWQSHLGNSESLFVNTATWGLMLTGKMLTPSETQPEPFQKSFSGLLTKQSHSVIRRAVRQAMRIMGKQFVLGETIAEARKRGKKWHKKGYNYSFDMLGEAACTDADAQHYYQQYQEAIDQIGQSNTQHDIAKSDGISVKLSALHPRYDLHHPKAVFKVLYPRLLTLAQAAKAHNIGFNIDAEEVERLELSLYLFETLAREPSLEHWDGLGLAIQAYQKRAPYVIDWVADLAKQTHRRFMVRLVKGAYWDAEIKHAQENGYAHYPVFTRKVYTDVSYLACVKKLFGYQQHIYPQFATHNAHTLAAVIEMAPQKAQFEFQCLHGMGDTLYNEVIGQDNLDIPCRIYAPVGGHQYLLSYLVRRLLENGANSSFVNRIADTKTPIDDLVANPITVAQHYQAKPHPQIPLPPQLYGDTRMNAKGIDLYHQPTLQQLEAELKTLDNRQWSAEPFVAGTVTTTAAEIAVKNPASPNESLGKVQFADADLANMAITHAKAAFNRWSNTSAEERAHYLEKAADLLEQHQTEFLALAIKEAGKTFANAISELREAVDFCRYYAEQTRLHFNKTTTLPGPTGESNELTLHGRGVFVCISPWNFPLAIFLGEVTAALAAGNTVIAKPAEQTSLIAAKAVECLYQAGIPRDVLQFLPGTGEAVGASLVNHSGIAGVIFTGSTETAHRIHQALAQKPGPIAPLIAETGGQNCMVVDSSALPEQVVNDVITSAFDSAGQRCSALRVLYLQSDVADTIIEMLIGAMQELNVGDPSQLSTDVGPVIDAEAQQGLLNHIDKLSQEAKLLYQTPIKSQTGHFVAPTVFEIQSIQQLSREVFGPILHIVRYNANELDRVIDEINSTGYGLTFGIHSRIQETIDKLSSRINVGNIYVNRNIVGAVVGTQPFGGQNLSGTGPKAGGPYYLPRLAVEKTLTVNTTASGGNASLMTLGD